MKVPPFSMREAEEIATDFQHLVGKEYLDGTTKEVYKILTVGVLPFFSYDKCVITHLYTGLMHRAEGFSMDSIFNFIENNHISEFDVVLTSRPTENNCIDLLVTSIDLIATESGLQYGFKVDLLQ